MKAIILSHERGGSYVLDSEGDYHFVKKHTSHPIGSEIEFYHQSRRRRFAAVAVVSCFALAVLLGVFTWLWDPGNNAESYFIYLSINPSVELSFNNQDELKAAKPLNDDGVALLEELTLQGSPGDVVIALLKEAIRKGYLNDQSDFPLVFITITADNDDISTAIMNAINIAINKNNLQNIVIVETDNMDLRSRADELGVSPGMLKLAEQLFACDQSVPVDEIAKMSIEDLALALRDSNAFPHGHVWGEWVVTTLPTCDDPGEETRVCANDPSHVETRGISALDHVWGGWVVTTLPTCGDPGEETRVCVNDPSHVETRSISALGHVWGGWVVTTLPTCDDPGEETRVCANDPSHVETRSISALGHAWDEGVVTNPTDVSDGFRTFTCLNCGETYSIVLPKITQEGFSVDAFIKKLNGNNNELTITVVEYGIDSISGEPTVTTYTAIFNIINNPGDRTYDVGPCKVFVSISGNTINVIRIEP